VLASPADESARDKQSRRWIGRNPCPQAPAEFERLAKTANPMEEMV
jgi:hypothetical protein